MKKVTELKTAGFLPLILFISSIVLLFSSQLNSIDKCIMAFTLVVFCFETYRLNMNIRNFRKKISVQNEEFLSILKHKFKTLSLSQIRAIELLLDGHFGRISVRQQEFFNIMLSSEKDMFDTINNKILSISKSN